MRAAIAGVLGVVLVLGCANPVEVGLRGLETGVDALTKRIEAGMPLIGEANVLIKEVEGKLSKECLPKIEELKGKIAKVVVLEEELGKVSNSLAVLAESPGVTAPLKERISTLKEKVDGLIGNITTLKEADKRLDELKVKIEEKGRKA